MRMTRSSRPSEAGPEIADAGVGFIEIGVEERSEHAALRGAARIAEGKIHFEDVNVAFENFAGVRYVEAFDVVGEAVNFRRRFRRCR